MENILHLMDVLVEKNNILGKLDSFTDSKCPILIYGDTYITLKRTTSVFRSESKFAANVEVSLDQILVLDAEGAASEYCLHIYVYQKENNKPVIRCDIKFYRMINYDKVLNMEIRVNYHNIDGYVGYYEDAITIHDLINLMFENQIDDIKGNDIETYKYYLKNLKGALEFALIDFIKGE